jgi:hypothetical protein
MNDNVNRKSPKKLLLTVIAVVLVAAIAVGATLAYMHIASGSVKNGFTPATIDITTVEDFDDGDIVKKDVYIKNDSNTGAYIRAAIAVTWQDENGNVYGEAPVSGTDYTIDGPEGGWVLGSDGYYYWVSAVAAGQTTENLINECKVLSKAPADGYTLHVEIAAQGIQASPKNAVVDAWGVTVDADGRISK